MFAHSLLRACLAAFALAGAALSAEAAQFNVAVAANFTEPAREIAAAFRARTGHEAVLSFGSSAQLLAQISQEAPFQVFLSADQERPAKAVQDRLAIADSRFTYAVGKLALWSRDPALVNGDATLKSGRFDKLAIANPAAAPYGAAAIETMKALGVFEALQPRIVQGSSIAQAYAFVDTRNAELGFVSLSQLANTPEGSRWIVPQALYNPIRQDAVLLAKGRDSEAARNFLDFLKGPEARDVIRRFGYEIAAP
ncbi:molybdate ABC transporter substrate-binding protein [Alsobacter metallidurans]|uniref:Molybdate ABC transporter substrate-binding protein n=1 Tax=Alsobacter metallidurans TaxID=340221 RepID=A0A917IC97_9HYPH|nr:molybdate ABC transporter substrate-binding protein [Alsobacter metallidurans]GGH32216.1 molybdate ABC transporter substrate-binding protein [Alsobacter metallidurans]